MRRSIGPLVLAVAGLGCLVGLAAGVVLTADAPADGPAGPVLPGWLPLDWFQLNWGLTAVRLVLDAFGVVAVGLTLLPLLLRGARARASAPALATAQRASIVAGAGWAGAAAVLLWLQTAAAINTVPWEVPASRVGEYLSAAVAGRALVVAGLAGLGVATAGVLTARRPALVPAGLPPVLAVLGVLALPVTGHAATAPVHELAVIATAVHVAGAAAWVGGLGAVAWLASPRRELLAAALPQYSRLATLCVVAVTATGIIGAALRLPSAAALLGTPYGWLLLGKSFGVLALGLFGARARTRLLPAVQARRTVRLTGWLATELAVMGAVLGLAALLADTAPPV